MGFYGACCHVILQVFAVYITLGFMDTWEEEFRAMLDGMTVDEISLALAQQKGHFGLANRRALAIAISASREKASHSASEYRREQREERDLALASEANDIARSARTWAIVAITISTITAAVVAYVQFIAAKP